MWPIILRAVYLVNKKSTAKAGSKLTGNLGVSQPGIVQ
jgi:hypothetical protein